MPFETLHKLVDRVRSETQLRSNESRDLMEATRAGMFRKGSRASFYADGLRECRVTLARLRDRSHR